MKIKDKVAIVTGAGRGIGKHIAIAFAREGAKVIVVARTSEEIDAVVAEINNEGGRATASKTDISKNRDVTLLMEASYRSLGAIDILVNNAAVNGPFKRIEDIDPEEWNRTVEININGLFLCCKAVIPYMKKSGKGKIINLLSAKSGMPMLSAYYSTKMAIRAFTDSLAAEVKHLNIDVNGYHPGGVMEGMLGSYLGKVHALDKDDPVKEYFERWLTKVESGTVPPEHAAKLALYFASPESDGVTGNNFSVYDKRMKHLIE